MEKWRFLEGFWFWSARSAKKGEGEIVVMETFALTQRFCSCCRSHCVFWQGRWSREPILWEIQAKSCLTHHLLCSSPGSETQSWHLYWLWRDDQIATDPFFFGECPRAHQTRDGTRDGNSFDPSGGFPAFDRPDSWGPESMDSMGIAWEQDQGRCLKHFAAILQFLLVIL